MTASSPASPTRFPDLAFEQAFEHARIGMALVSLSGQVVAVNAALCAWLGRSRDEVVGKELRAFVSAEERASEVVLRDRLLQREIDSFQGHVHFLDKGGGLLFMDATVRLSPDRDGKPDHFLWQLSLGPQAVSPQDTLRGILEAASDALLLVDRRGDIVQVNSRLERLFGYSRSELVGLSAQVVLADYGSPRSSPTSPSGYGGTSFELSAKRRDGTEFPSEIRVSPVETHGGAFVIVAVRDVSERKRLKAQVDHQAELYRTMVGNIPRGAVFVLDDHLRYLAADGPAVADVLGLGSLRPEEVKGRRVEEFFDRNDHAVILEACERAAAGESRRAELRRGERFYEVTAVPMRRGPSAAILVLCYDITERKKSESVLQLHSVVVSTMAEGIAVVRADDESIVYANPKLEAILMCAPGSMVGKSAHAFLSDATRPEVAAATHPASDRREVRLRRADGTTVHCRLGVTLLHYPELGPVYVTLCEDVTEAHALKERLMLSDRMASLGTLASGIAHEINNPLVYVLSNLELVADGLRKLDTTSPIVQGLNEMVEDARLGADQVASIVRGMRAFARADAEKRVPIDVHKALDLALSMSQSEAKQRAILVKELGEVPFVSADEARLAQVFLNLLVNATQAIPKGHANENRIVVRTGTTPRGEAFVEVSDTGSGIAPAHLPRIFDPFYSTKAVGEGTGLGLSICHGIVTSLGGRIEVSSTVGKGAAFRVVLPRAPQESRTEEAPEALTLPSRERRGKILVVDDDVAVRRTLDRVLGEHDVTLVTNGEEALARLRQDPSFDLVLCDLMMPVMTGSVLFSTLRKEHPELASRFVFITGDVFTPNTQAFLAEVPNERVEKPFRSRDLQAMVSRYLR